MTSSTFFASSWWTLRYSDSSYNLTDTSLVTLARLPTKGKAVNSVHIVCLSIYLSAQNCQIWRSRRHNSIIAVSEMWENLPSLAFYVLEKGHKRYKSHISIRHTFQPHPVMPCAAMCCHVLPCAAMCCMPELCLNCACYYWCWCSMLGDLIILVDSLSISLGTGLSITLKVGVKLPGWQL